MRNGMINNINQQTQKNISPQKPLHIQEQTFNETAPLLDERLRKKFLLKTQRQVINKFNNDYNGLYNPQKEWRILQRQEDPNLELGSDTEFE